MTSARNDRSHHVGIRARIAFELLEAGSLEFDSG